MDKTDAVSAPQVPIRVFDTDGQEMTVDVEDLYFTQYAVMALFLKLGFMSSDIHVVKNALQPGVRSVPFYGVALLTQGLTCVCTTYPRDCIRMNVEGHSVFCSIEVVLAGWPEYVKRANCPGDKAFEERMRLHHVHNILQTVQTLNTKGFVIPVFNRVTLG